MFSKNIKETTIVKGFNFLKNRGKDSSNYLYNKKENIFLGHHRLSINGNSIQPIERNNCIAMVNGEFYEVNKIKKKNNIYIKEDESDSSILIPLYKKFGMNKEFFKKLNGEFSFILFDEIKNKVYFARDRFGIKPLYFYFDKVTKKTIISSEMKGILKTNIDLFGINKEALDFCFTFQYLYPSETLIKGIEECIPGFIYEIDLTTFVLEKMEYYDIVFDRKLDNEKDISKKVKKAIKKAIDIRCENVPNITTYLSGGLDSSLVTKICAENKINKLKESFQVDFEENGEYIYANKVANELNIKLNSYLFLNEKENINIKKTNNIEYVDFDKIISESVFLSEGLSINQHFPTKLLLNKKIVDKKYKVILSGEGADEFFLGYPFFKQEIGIELNPFEKEFYDKYQFSNEYSYFEKKYKRFNELPLWAKVKFKTFYKLGDFLGLKIDKSKEIDKFLSIGNNIRNNGLKIDYSIYSWVKYALSGYILRTLDDGLSMAIGLETRTPYLDYKLVDLINKIKIDKLYNFGIFQKEEKALLKNIALKEFYLDKEIVFRKKQSFLGTNNNIKKEELLKELEKVFKINNKMEKEMNDENILYFYLNTFLRFKEYFLNDNDNILEEEI
jgi:asparagine synthase (glutamine-hydrolysing)